MSPRATVPSQSMSDQATNPDLSDSAFHSRQRFEPTADGQKQSESPVPAHRTPTDTPAQTPQLDKRVDNAMVPAQHTAAHTVTAATTDAATTHAATTDFPGPRPLEWISTRSWLLIGVVVIAGAFAAGLWWDPAGDSQQRVLGQQESADSAARPGSNGTTGDAHSGEPQVTILEQTPTIVPTLAVALIPTATPTPQPTLERLEIVPVEPAASDEEVQLPPTGPLTESLALAIELPTVTPTPLPPPVIPRAVDVGGQASLRMQMTNEGFQSGGRPIQLAVTPRTHLLDGETLRTEDSWCIQMGLVNIDLNLTFELQPSTSAIITRGTAELYNDFCENRGNLFDSANISLTVPADARSQSTYNLFGERQLLNLSGLLDMDMGVILELNIANLRPDRAQ